jgi:hypothetical protein
MSEFNNLKTCSRCHSTILLSFFEKNRQGEHYKTCNNCRYINRENFKSYRDNNTEKELERNRRFREENKQYFQNQNKEYYEQHKDDILERKKVYRENNKEQIKEKRKEYVEKNKENITLRQQTYRLENKEKIALRDNEKFNCECGGCYTRKNKPAHERGKAHIYWTLTGVRTNCLTIDCNWFEHLKELQAKTT